HCRDWQRRACADGEALLVGRKRPCPVACRPPHVADLLEAYAHVALPAGIARIDSGELARDGEAFLIGRKRARAVARSRVEAEVDRQVRRADSVENDRWLLKKDFQEEFRGILIHDQEPIIRATGCIRYGSVQNGFRDEPLETW